MVVFEKLYLVLDVKHIPVTAHEDLTDAGQTIKFVEEEIPPETPESNPPESNPPKTNPPKTGDTANIIPWIAIAVLSAAGVGWGIWKIRRINRTGVDKK